AKPVSIMCRLCFKEPLGLSRALAVFSAFMGAVNLVLAVVESPLWQIICRSVMFIVQVGAAVGVFAAIHISAAHLMIPVMCMSVLNIILNAVQLVFAVSGLLYPESFYANYIRGDRPIDDDSDSLVTSRCISTLIPAAITLSICLRGIFAHLTVYRLIQERRRSKYMTE
ncbi:hypothetical protein PFISCL1PPCAC_3436, partial [Pristionchus fissidentatus]